MMTNSPNRLFLIVPDLVARTSIKGALHNLDLEVVNIKKIEDLKVNLPDSNEFNTTKLIIDLNHSGLNPFEIISESLPYLRSENIIAFYSHVNSELKERAELLGIQKIYPRSKFFNDISTIVSG